MLSPGLALTVSAVLVRVEFLEVMEVVFEVSMTFCFFIHQR